MNKVQKELINNLEKENLRHFSSIEDNLKKMRMISGEESLTLYTFQEARPELGIFEAYAMKTLDTKWTHEYMIPFDNVIHYGKLNNEVWESPASIVDIALPLYKESVENEAHPLWVSVYSKVVDMLEAEKVKLGLN